MLGLILTGVLAAGTVAGAAPEAQPVPTKAEAMAALPSSDLDIKRALIAAHKATPEKVVCVTRTLTGTRQPRPICASLERWFNARLPAEIAAQEAPWQLVEGVKEARRKALARDRTGNRGG